MKYLIPLLLLFSCKERELKPPPHRCTPSMHTIEYRTEYVPMIDTLVIIQTYDTLPAPKDSFATRNLGWETSPMYLFSDGKRSDTIKRHTIIYR
jgi:hypothetical protein